MPWKRNAWNAEIPLLEEAIKNSAPINAEPRITIGKMQTVPTT